jgi:siroheme synthase
VTLVTAHAARDEGDAQDPAADLPSRGTLVFYMGLGRLRETSRALVQAGRAPETPAAVVSRATLPGERVIVGTLADISERAEAATVQPPALLVVGEVIAHRVESPSAVAAPTSRRALSGS